MARILIVDDESRLRRSFSLLLELDGHNVASAEDADTALAALAAEPFDVLISDIVLPRISGVELVQRALALCPDLKTVLITGDLSEENVERAESVGVDDYLRKPVSRQALADAVSRAVPGR